LIRSLELVAFKPQYFSETEQSWMVRTSLLTHDRQAFHPEFYKTIGQSLYSALIPAGSEVERLLNESIQIARARQVQLLVQLKFEDDAVQTARLPDYPWELLHDGKGFLLHNQVGFSRYIAFPSVPPSLPSVEQVNVLLISSGASDKSLGLNPLPKKERAVIAETLTTAIANQKIRLTELSEATLDELSAYLTKSTGENAPHLLHFDGHGLFGKRCTNPECRTMHKGTRETCKSCGVLLPKAQGYLVFEDEYGDPDYVSAAQLGTVLRQTRQSDGTHQVGGVAALVLSACQSGMAVAGDSVFQGTAQNLIYHSIPSVVAMQYSVTVGAAIAFVKQFYRSIGEKNSLAVAVSQGRAMMGVDENQWYRPVLYLRWQDNEGGQLFAASQTPEKSELRIGAPFQAPAIPESFIERPDITQELKRRLFSQNSTLVISAIHGLGAVGKTAIAAALAHDPEVQKQFPDGILWTTLGQEPELKILQELEKWIKALGDYQFQAQNQQEASDHLKGLLKEKKALLIVDDAWNFRHAEFFKVGGSGCQMLVTTRDSGVAYGLKASVYPLDVMKPKEALELLARKLKRNFTGAEAEEAAQLARAVGYLPLALELAAAQVAEGKTSWQQLLQDLESEVARLKSLDLPSAKDHQNDDEARKIFSLTASLNLSVKCLDDSDRWDFIWLGITPEDTLINPKMAKVLWQREDVGDAQDSLIYLQNKALLLPGLALQDGTPTYRMHDLVHDLARNLLTAPQKAKRRGDLEGLGITLPEAHRELVERYRAEQKTQGLWHSLPEDSYIHQHLVWHLEKAGQIEEIHNLLAETSVTGANGWFEVREKIGQADGFARELRQAWDLADRAWQETRSAKAMGLQCRYALMQTSLNSISSALSAELFGIILKYHYWSFDQVLTYVLRQKPEQRVEKLSYLSQELGDRLSTQEQEIIFVESIASAQEIEDASKRAKALVAMVSKDPQNILPKAIAAIREITRLETRLEILKTLAPEVTKAVLSEALAAAWEIEFELYKLQALCALAPKDPENIVPDILAATRRIKENHYKSEIITTLAPQITKNHLPEALSIAREIEGEENRAKAIAALALQDSELLPETLIAIQEIDYGPKRIECFLVLISRYPQKVLPKALATLREISGKCEDYIVANSFASLTPYLTEVFLSDAFAILHDIQKEHDRTKALIALVPYITETFVPKALAVVREIQEERLQSEALAALVPKMTRTLLSEALIIARSIKSSEIRAKVLTSLVSSDPESILPDIFYAISEIEEESSKRANILIALTPSITEHFLPNALAAIQQLSEEFDQTNALESLAPLVTKDSLYSVLATIRQIKSALYRAYALGALVPKHPELLSETLANAKAMNFSQLGLQGIQSTYSSEIKYEKDNRIGLLVDLFPYITTTDLPDAIAVAREIRDPMTRSEALTILVAKDPERILPEVLKNARLIDDFYQLASILTVLVDYDLDGILPEAIITARKVIDSEERGKVFAALAKHDPGSSLPEVFSAMSKIFTGSDGKLRVIRRVAPHVTEAFLSQAFSSAHDISARHGFRYSALCALAPYVTETFLQEAIEIFVGMDHHDYRAMFFSALVPKISEPFLSKAFDSIREIGSQQFRDNAFVAIAPKITTPFLSEAIAIGREIEDDHMRAAFFRTLVPQDVECILPEALVAARKIEAPYDQAIALTALVPYDPENILPNALTSALKIEDFNYQANALTYLVSYDPKNILPEALAAARKIEAPYDQAVALTALVPYDSENILSEALTAARKIDNPEARAKALTPLVPYDHEGIFPEALAAVRAFEYFMEDQLAIYNQSNTLAALAPQVTEEFLSEALIAANEIGIEQYRYEALIALAPQVTEGHLPKALATALDIKDEEYRISSLSALVSEAAKNYPTSKVLLDEWQTILHHLSGNQRFSLLRAIQAMIPIIFAVGNKEAIQETCQTIQQVFHWWR
jgi:CHAT domain-containing protein